MIGYALNRPERQFSSAAVARRFAGKRVVVTGAAGSIGSTLALELATLRCEHLTLLDHYDHGLIEIHESVRRMVPAASVSDVLCDVRDAARLEGCLRRARPDIVLHSAALKHVHLGERHPGECVLTNLVGVRNALSAAASAGASDFVLVSSDKAAAPVCVMGATKRLAELFLNWFGAERANVIRCKSVRFGNVLGTQGSVLPRFAAQIAAGGPLEVTHPEMERFFMSPQEAVGLVLGVAALQDHGTGAYVMEMGDAVRIVDIGNEMIRRSGKQIEIAFTGLRPGEKLKEQLEDEHETSAECALPGVFRMTPRAAGARITASDVAQLELVARAGEDSLVRSRLFALLDERLGRQQRAAG